MGKFTHHGLNIIVKNNDMIQLKWQMDGHYNFTAEAEGYLVTISGSSRGWWHWYITKDDETIDTCYYHSPTHNELAAKVQAEKVLNRIVAAQVCDARDDDQ